MKMVNITEFRKNASALLGEVEGGEHLTVLRHGKPVAEVSPVARGAEGTPSWKRRGLRLTAKGAALSDAIVEGRREDLR